MAVELLKIGSRIQEQTTLNEVLPDKFVFSGSLDTNVYEDVTSNKNWIEIGCNYYDFLFCRNQIMQWTYVKTAIMGNPFSGLTQEDQEYAARYYAVGKPERESVFNQNDLKEYWREFILTANKTRKKRWEEAEAMISFELEMSESIDMAKSTNSLSSEYITYGIEEYSADGVDGLFDWIESKAGFSGGTGFDAKSYYTTGLTQDIMLILRDGIY